MALWLLLVLVILVFASGKFFEEFSDSAKKILNILSYFSVFIFCVSLLSIMFILISILAHPTEIIKQEDPISLEQGYICYFEGKDPVIIMVKQENNTVKMVNLYCNVKLISGEPKLIQFIKQPAGKFWYWLYSFDKKTVSAIVSLPEK